MECNKVFFSKLNYPRKDGGFHGQTVSFREGNHGISRLHWDLGDGRASVGYPSEKKPTLRKSKTMKEAMERQELEDSFEGILNIQDFLYRNLLYLANLQCGNSTVVFRKKGHVFFFRCRFFFWVGCFSCIIGDAFKKKRLWRKSNISWLGAGPNV